MAYINASVYIALDYVTVISIPKITNRYDNAFPYTALTGYIHTVSGPHSLIICIFMCTKKKKKNLSNKTSAEFTT